MPNVQKVGWFSWAVMVLERLILLQQLPTTEPDSVIHLSSSWFQICSITCVQPLAPTAALRLTAASTKFAPLRF
jgi:hypothetical protein